MKSKKHSSQDVDRYSYVLSGIKLSKPLTIKQIKTIFLVVLCDYLNGETSPTLLESMSGDLLYHFCESPDKLKDSDQSLAYVLDLASDVSYYEQRKDDENSVKQFQDAQDSFAKYYALNKYLLQGEILDNG